jgi:predicted acylesterase/phospholipase RssA
MPTGAGELRIALTISGAVSLGAFEAGALAALLKGVQKVNAQPGAQDALRVDVITGASAGSMTALVAARALLAGLDPVDLMTRAWVDMPQLDALSDGLDAPLTIDEMLKTAQKMIGETGSQPRQRCAVRLHMALGSLHRLDYRVGRVGGPPVDASTYLDWDTYTLDADATPATYEAALESAMASGAHALAFLPRPLDRERSDVVDRYGVNRVIDPPGRAWYTDGGTIDNQPLGRALDLAHDVDLQDDPIDAAARLHLLIVPDPPETAARGGDRWTAGEQPRWTTTLARVMTLLRAQHLYDDLERLEQTNARISATTTLARALAEAIEPGDTDKTPEERLEDAITEIKGQQQHLDSPRDVLDGVAPDSAIGQLVMQALDLATGFARKRYVELAVVSPAMRPEVANESKAVRDVLSGAFLGHFGGFLNRRLRANDFALGYDCMVRWMDSGLVDNHLEEGLASAAISAARDGQPPWDDKLAGAGLDSLGVREKVALGRLALRTAAITLHDVPLDALDE